MTLNLNARQTQAYLFIRDQIKATGIPPSYAEIAGHLGSPKSKANALYIVDELVAQGLLSRVGRRARALQLVQTENHHAPDCACGACAGKRYSAQLDLIKGLQRTAEPALARKMNNIRPLSRRTRVYWLDGFPPSFAGDAA